MIVEDKSINELPVVSTVVCTYNQETTIVQCIESIITQKCSYPFELIIGEDCGTDSTRQICIEYQKKYPKIIRLLLQDTNKGLMRNYPDVMSLCRGKYVAQCAGDDYWCDELKIQKQVDFLEKNPDYGLVRTGYYELFPKTNKLVEGKGHTTEAGDIFQIAKYGAIGAAASICFKRELLQYIDFNEFIRRKFSMEDYPMHAIFAKHTKCGYIPDITTVYRLSLSSASRPKNEESRMRYNEGYIAVRTYLAELFPGEINFDHVEAQDALNYNKLQSAYKDWNYKQASDLVAGIQTEKYKNKRLVKYGKNIFGFYILNSIRSMLAQIKGA